MAIEIRFIFALLVSLEFVINVNELPFFSKQELLAMRRKYQGLLYGMRGNITIVSLRSISEMLLSKGTKNYA